MKRKILIGCVMLILGLNTISVKADIKEHRTTWDCIWFGTYPQTEITDRSSITSKTTYLRDSGGCVIGYNVKYYNKGGEEVFCKEAHMDEMKYFNRLPDNNKGYDWKTWNGEHYFRYEPIKWRILKKICRKMCTIIMVLTTQSLSAHLSMRLNRLYMKLLYS